MAETFQREPAPGDSFGPVEWWDERATMGRTAGGMWLLASLVAVAGLYLPGAPNEHATGVLILSGCMLVYAIGCLTRVIPWETTSLRTHAIVTGALLPVIGLGLWLTGGAVSYLLPMLICLLLYVSWFFPPRYAWPLSFGVIVVAGSPFVYEANLEMYAFPSRILAIAAGFLAVTAVMANLKRRLVEAEARQRTMAVTDPLTGVGNRRAFDSAIERELSIHGMPQRGRRRTDTVDGLAILFFDLDGFKGINDRYGHPTGDQVLREVAARAGGVLRPADTLTRMGGDEFAVIAPHCGDAGAQRMADEICEAVTNVQPAPSADSVNATVAYAVYPGDGLDSGTLMRVADRRLLASKGTGAPLRAIASDASS